MNRNDLNIDEKIKRVFSDETPDVFDSVLSDVKNQKRQVRTVNKQTINRKTKFMVAFAACFVAVFALVAGIVFTGGDKAAAVVSIDVNPSIRLEVDEDGKVLNVRAMNDDAAEILGDMDLKGCTVEVAVNAIVGSMVQAGKLSELQNSILLSVQAFDSANGYKIKKRITDEINKKMTESGLGAAILVQNVTESKDLKKLAEQYGITEGKAKLIENILNVAPQYTFEQLVGLTVNELNVLISNAITVPDGVQSTGTASTSKYISADRAKAIALELAGKSEAEVFGLEVEFEADDGKIVYEVEFDADGKEYEYEIDAISGEKVKEKIKNKKSSPSTKPEGYVSADEAKAAALNYVGKTVEDVTYFSKIKLDADDDGAEYEIEFVIERVETVTEYEIDVDATTGKVLSAKCKTVSKTPAQSGEHISAYAAWKIAIKCAGFEEPTGFVAEKIELEYEDGRYEYEVEFVVDGVEYECKIDAVTGEVLEFEIERD